MPTKKRKGRARQPFRNGAAGRPPAASPKGVVEEGAMATTAQAATASAVRTQRAASAEPSRAMVLQHAQVSAEIRKIGLITGTIFLILIVLSFILPRIT